MEPVLAAASNETDCPNLQNETIVADTCNQRDYCMYVKLRFAAALPIIDVRVQVQSLYGSGYGTLRVVVYCTIVGSGGQSSVGQWLRAKVESQGLTEPTFTHQDSTKRTGSALSL